mgnify:CR=1 FL=1
MKVVFSIPLVGVPSMTPVEPLIERPAGRSGDMVKFKVVSFPLSRLGARRSDSPTWPMVKLSVLTLAMSKASVVTS